MEARHVTWVFAALGWACTGDAVLGTDASATSAGVGGESTTTTASSGTGGATGGAAPEDHCGDGVVDEGEDCDSDDLTSADCLSLGFSGGTLYCDAHCRFMTAACSPAEHCVDDFDNDQDGAHDCDDDDCSTHPFCLDPCAASTHYDAMGFPMFIPLAGKPSVHATSCGAGTGRDFAMRFVAFKDGIVIFNGESFGTAGVGVNLAIRTSCSDPTTEVACADNPNGQFFTTITHPVTKGQVYYLMVDEPSATPDLDAVMVSGGYTQ